MKKIIKSPKLLLALTLLFGFSITCTAKSFAILPKEPILDQEKFIFIDTHIHTEGIGEVGGGLMIDFPTYSYSSETKTLRSQRPVSTFGQDTKVIVGSGRSISGTAGGGAATGLRAYSSFSLPETFSIDYRFALKFLMNGEYRFVPVGETWTETVESKPTVGDGKIITTYTIHNYGVHDKANFIQPGPLPTEAVVSPTQTQTTTQTPIPTSTPTSTPTTVTTPAEPKKYKVSGYILPEPKLNSKNLLEGFKVEIPELKLSTTTDQSGYFRFDGIPDNTGTYANRYTFKISKVGYLTREIQNIWLRNDLEIGLAEYPVSILSGDLDNDGAINMTDVIEVAKAFNLTSTDPLFNKTADMNYDNVISMSDIMIIAKNFNQSSSSYTAAVKVNLTYITMQKNDTIEIVLKRIQSGGWGYSISNENIIKLKSETPGVFGVNNEDKWTFEAISPGETDIFFLSTYGYTFEKYLFKVTDSAYATPEL